MLHLIGRWPESVRAFNESIELCRSFGGVFGEVLGEQRVAQIETNIGRFDAAYERLQRVLAQALSSESPMVKAHSFSRLYAGLALNRYEAGDLTEATRFLASGFENQQAIGECISCDLFLYPAAVPIYIAHGIAHGQMSLAEQACSKAQEMAAAFGSRSWIATSHHLIGVLSQAQGDDQAAAAQFQEAAASFEALGQPFDQARALECLSSVRATKHGQEREAHDLIERAAAIYLELGAPARAEHARSIVTLRE